MDSSKDDLVQALVEKLIQAERAADKRLFTEQFTTNDAANDTEAPESDEIGKQELFHYCSRFFSSDLTYYTVKLIAIVWVLIMAFEMMSDFLGSIIPFIEDVLVYYLPGNGFSIE
jgi:hypothetical protein